MKDKKKFNGNKKEILALVGTDIINNKEIRENKRYWKNWQKNFV